MSGEPEFLNSKQTAALLQRSLDWLHRARRKPGKGPPYYRIGGGIMYREQEIMAWLRSVRSE